MEDTTKKDTYKVAIRLTLTEIQKTDIDYRAAENNLNVLPYIRSVLFPEDHIYMPSGEYVHSDNTEENQDDKAIYTDVDGNEIIDSLDNEYGDMYIPDELCTYDIADHVHSLDDTMYIADESQAGQASNYVHSNETETEQATTETDITDVDQSTEKTDCEKTCRDYVNFICIYNDLLREVEVLKDKLIKFKDSDPEELEKATNKIDSLMDKIDEKDKTIEELEADINSKANTITNLESSMSTKSSEMEKLQKDTQEKFKELSELRRQSKDDSQRIEKLMVDITSLNQKLSDNDSKIREANKLKEYAERQLQEKVKVYGEMETKLTNEQSEAIKMKQIINISVLRESHDKIYNEAKQSIRIWQITAGVFSFMFFIMLVLRLVK